MGTKCFRAKKKSGLNKYLFMYKVAKFSINHLKIGRFEQPLSKTKYYGININYKFK